MEELLNEIAGHVALAVETVAVLVVSFGAVEALFRTLARGFQRPKGWGRPIWADFGAWLLGGLQFALAADIVRSAISPGWEEIGQLAAIAAIRTFLSYFLEKDLVEERRLEAEEQAQAKGAEGPPRLG
jgi:uncharacterized membrane protein